MTRDDSKRQKEIRDRVMQGEETYEDKEIKRYQMVQSALGIIRNLIMLGIVAWFLLVSIRGY